MGRPHPGQPRSVRPRWLVSNRTQVAPVAGLVVLGSLPTPVGSGPGRVANGGAAASVRGVLYEAAECEAVGVRAGLDDAPDARQTGALRGRDELLDDREGL